MRTRLVCTIGNEGIVRALFQHSADELTFQKALNIASEMEEAAEASREVVHGALDSATTPILKVQPRQKRKMVASGKGPSTAPAKGATPKGACPRCGKSGHDGKECRFINAACRFCQKKGHLEAVCRQKRAAQSEAAKVGYIVPEKVGGIVPREPTRAVQSRPDDTRSRHRIFTQRVAEREATSIEAGRTSAFSRSPSAGQAGERSCEDSAGQAQSCVHDGDTVLRIVLWPEKE